MGRGNQSVSMMSEQRVRSEHRETEDRGSDHEQIEDIEDLVDDLGDAVQVGHVPRLEQTVQIRANRCI